MFLCSAALHAGMPLALHHSWVQKWESWESSCPLGLCKRTILFSGQSQSLQRPCNAWRGLEQNAFILCVCVCVRMCMCVWVSVKARHTACIHTYQMRNRSTWNVSHIGSFSRQSLLIAPLQHVTSLSASVFCQLVTHKSWYTEDINFTRWPIDLFVLFWLLPLFCHPIKVRNKTLLIL